MTREQYAVVVPVKPPALGKSRLVGLPDERRRDLAAAFALDTVAACLAADSVARVLAVTDDAPFARRLVEAGCAAIPDGVAGDLNGSLRLAAAEVSRRWPGLVPVAVCADLPSLRARGSRRRARADSPGPRGVRGRRRRGRHHAVRRAARARSTRASVRTRGRPISRPAAGRFRASLPPCAATWTTWRTCARRGSSASALTRQPSRTTHNAVMVGHLRRGDPPSRDERVQDFLAAAFLVVEVFFAGADVDLLAVDLAAVLFVAVDLVAVDLLAGFFAVDLLAVDLAAVLFVAVDLLAVDLAAVLFVAVDLVAGALLAGAFFADVLVAGAFLAAVFVAVVLAVVVFLAGVVLAAVFLADVFAGALLAVVFAGEAFLAADAADAAALPGAAAAAPAAASVSLGSFLAPETTFFRSAPGLNFGTAFFFALMR